jgi:hypothetical protein
VMGERIFSRKVGRVSRYGDSESSSSTLAGGEN